VPSQLIVRPVAPTDLGQWEPLWEGYNHFYKRTVPAEVTRMTWSRFFDAWGVGRALIEAVYDKARDAGSPAFTGKRTKPT
jgi:hypothetical protein